MLRFPPLASQEDGSRYLVLAACVIGDLSTRQPERLGGLGEAQLVPPPPANELHRIGSSVLLERLLPERISTHIQSVGPRDTVPILPESDPDELFLVEKPSQSLRAAQAVVKINTHDPAVCEPNSKPVVADRFDRGDS